MAETSSTCMQVGQSEALPLRTTRAQDLCALPVARVRSRNRKKPRHNKRVQHGNDAVRAVCRRQEWRREYSEGQTVAVPPGRPVRS